MRQRGRPGGAAWRACPLPGAIRMPARLPQCSWRALKAVHLTLMPSRMVRVLTISGAGPGLVHWATTLPSAHSADQASHPGVVAFTCAQAGAAKGSGPARRCRGRQERQAVRPSGQGEGCCAWHAGAVLRMPW